MLLAQVRAGLHDPLDEAGLNNLQAARQQRQSFGRGDGISGIIVAATDDLTTRMGCHLFGAGSRDERVEYQRERRQLVKQVFAFDHRDIRPSMLLGKVPMAPLTIRRPCGGDDELERFARWCADAMDGTMPAPEHTDV